MLSSSRKLFKTLIAVFVICLTGIGVRNGSGLCLQKGAAFPDDELLLDRAVQSFISNSQLAFMARRFEDFGSSDSEITPFVNAADYLAAYPDCCGIVRNSPIPHEVNAAALYLIQAPHLADKIFGRGRYVGYARFAAIKQHNGGAENVQSPRLSLFWLDNCGSSVSVPRSRQIG